MPVGIVTGGAKGIGLAICKRLLELGWDMSAIDTDRQRLAEVEASHPGLRTFVGDVGDAASIEQVVADVVADAGPLDLFVNNAGIAVPAPIVDLDEADWRRVLDINLTGAFLGMRAAGRVMLDQGSGSVVSISSVAAERGHVGRSPYAAAKAGIGALTRVAAAEWAPYGVRANAVAPGYIDTPMYRDLVKVGKIDESSVVSTIPMRKLGTGDDVAAAVAWLGSDEARYVTGQTLYVDGGFMVDYPPSRAVGPAA